MKILIVIKFNIFLILLLPLFSKIIILRPNRYISKLSKIINFFTFKKIEIFENIKADEYDNIDVRSREEITKILNHNNIKFEIEKFLRFFLDSQNANLFLKKSIYHYLFLLDIYKCIKILKKKNNSFYLFYENDISKILKIKFIFRKNFFFNLIDNLLKIIFLLKIKIKYRRIISPISKKYILASEINNFKFFNKKIGEPNYLDLKNTIYYLTEKMNIDEYPYDRFLKRKKFDYIDLRNVSPNKIFWKKFKKAIFDLPNFSSYNIKFFYLFFSQYNAYNNLHNNIKDIKYHLVLESSNDLRLINLETPLAKFVSNQHSCKLISYQTRTPYIFDPLSYFSNYDYYFSWSKFWYNKSNINAKKIFYGSPFTFNDNFNSLSRIITVFPSEINDSIHCSKKYFLKFFETILILCDTYKNYNFYFKMKYTNQFDPSKSDYKIPANLKFYDSHPDLYKLILKSNIVISQSYTSPGFYALGLGIKSLILSHLDIDNNNLKDLPIVHKYNEKFFYSFNKYLSNRGLDIFLRSRDKLFSKDELKLKIFDLIKT